MKRGRPVDSAKDDKKLTPHYFSAIFHIRKTGDITPIRHGDDLPGIERKKTPGKKVKNRVITAAFIKQWLKDHDDSTDYS